MRHTHTVLFLLAVAWPRVGSLQAQQPAAAASDSARLQGTWSMLAGSADGQPMPPSYVQSMQRAATGNALSITMGGRIFFKATIHLDPSKRPREIDYLMTAGPTTGATQLGIYTIKGDTARFAFGAPGKPRPTDFTTTPGDGRTLSTWVRVKP